MANAFSEASQMLDNALMQLQQQIQTFNNNDEGAFEIRQMTQSSNTHFLCFYALCRQFLIAVGSSSVPFARAHTF